MEQFQKFRHGINLLAFDLANYWFVSLITFHTTEWFSREKKKKEITTEKQNQILNHVQDILSLSNKLCELVRKEIIAVKLDCFSQESVNKIKKQL